MMFVRSLLVAASILAIAAPALAANGGGSGGGGAPSASGSGADPAKRYAEGVEHLKAGSFKQAERAFDDVLDVAGRDANTNYMMALAHVGHINHLDWRCHMGEHVTLPDGRAEAWKSAGRSREPPADPLRLYRHARPRRSLPCAANGQCPPLRLRSQPVSAASGAR